MKKNIYIIVITLLVAIIVINSILYIYKPPSDSILLKENWSVESNNINEKNLKIPIRYFLTDKKENEIGYNIFTTSFSLKDKNKNYALVFPALIGNSFEVYINDHLINLIGDYIHGNTSRWNYAHLIYIPKEYINCDSLNILKIKIFALSDFGIIKIPFINEFKVASKFVFKLNFLNNNLLSFSIGFMLLLGFLFIFIYVFIKEPAGTLELGIAFLCLSIYFFDYLYIEFLPIRYVLFKKIVVLNMHLFCAFILIGFIKYFNKKFYLFAKVTIFLSFLSAILIISAPMDLIALQKLYLILNLFTFLTMGNVLYITGKDSNKNDKALLSFSATLFSIPFYITDIVRLAAMNNNGIILVSHFGVIFFYLLTSFLIINNFIDFHNQMLKERRRADLMYESSLKDPLTGAFNRNLFENVYKFLSKFYSIAIVDLDDFKSINDNYGHLTGDEVLKETVRIISSNIRKSDYIIRYGGDEFLIILFDCSFDKALNIITTIHQNIKQAKVKVYDSDTYINFNCSIGLSEAVKNKDFNTLFCEIDHKLYEAKKSGKGIICY